MVCLCCSWLIHCPVLGPPLFFMLRREKMLHKILLRDHSKRIRMVVRLCQNHIYIYIQNSRHFNAQFSNLTVPAFVPTEGIYLLYSGYAQVRRKPVQHAVIRPAFVSGCIWSVGFLFMIKGIHELLGSTCCDAKIQQFWESWAILRPKF